MNFINFTVGISHQSISDNVKSIQYSLLVDILMVAAFQIDRCIVQSREIVNVDRVVRFFIIINYS